MAAPNRISATGRNAPSGIDRRQEGACTRGLGLQIAARAARAVGRTISRRIVLPLLHRHQERRCYTEQMALDERTLKDIGISRSDI